MPPRKAKDDKPAKPLTDEERGGAVDKAGEAVNNGDNGGENNGTDQGTNAEAAAETGSGSLSAEGTTAEESGKPEAEDGEHIEKPTDQTAFDRRIERLQNIAEEAEFESGSLVGDVRDFLVDLFKTRPKPWAQMSAGDQRDLYNAAEAVAKKLIRKLVVVVAEEDEITVHAKLNGYSADGETFKVKATVQADEDTAVQLYRLDGHEVVILSADSTRFTGQKREPAVMPDQGALSFADGQAKPEGGGEAAEPEHPADDSDLAEAGEREEEPEKPFERVNLKTSMIERVRADFDLKSVPEGERLPDDAFEDVREATPEELAAERERLQADFGED